MQRALLLRRPWLQLRNDDERRKNDPSIFISVKPWHSSRRICQWQVRFARSDPGDGAKQQRQPMLVFPEPLRNANKFIPQIALGSTLLALAYPPSFTWFTTRYFTPTLGYLMFAAGISLTLKDFLLAFEYPWPVVLGYVGQYVLKPLLGVIFAYLAVTYLHLPPSIGSGLILVSCVSGAQLSNYATYLTEPSMTALSITMTALSTVTAVFVTPSLSYLLLGKRLELDVAGMMFSILQVVVLPIALGQIMNMYFGFVSSAVRPFLPSLSVLATACCVGAPLATNIRVLRSPFGLKLLLPVVGMHATAFFLGYQVSRLAFRQSRDQTALAKTISLETGMQSSLLGLALANKFFADPLVALPSAISVVAMTLMGFSLVEFWNRKQPPLQNEASTS